MSAKKILLNDGSIITKYLKRNEKNKVISELPRKNCC